MSAVLCPTRRHRIQYHINQHICTITVGRLIGRSVGRLIGRLIGRLVGRLIGRVRVVKGADEGGFDDEPYTHTTRPSLKVVKGLNG